MFPRRVLLSLAGVLGTVVVSSCASSPVVGSTYLTRAQMTGSGSPQLRTVDNAGFVYPGGQTAEVGQGVGPAVVGRGGYMTRPPLQEGSGERPTTSARGLSQPPQADRYQAIGRVASALCDLETTCERIGPNGSFESADACTTEQRARLTDRMARPGCEATVRGDTLATCLRAIRAAACIDDAKSSTMPPSCEEALPSCGG